MARIPLNPKHGGFHCFFHDKGNGHAHYLLLLCNLNKILKITKKRGQNLISSNVSKCWRYQELSIFCNLSFASTGLLFVVQTIVSQYEWLYTEISCEDKLFFYNHGIKKKKSISSNLCDVQIVCNWPVCFDLSVLENKRDVRKHIFH